MSSPIPETTDTSPPVLIPSYPFTNSPVADVILRSCDGADFYILRGILSLLSPVFATMFRLPQPHPTPEVPVVEMNEDVVTLDKVLRFIYPGTEPIVDSLDDLRTIIELAIRKYDMQCEIPKVKRYLKGYCSTQYLGVYAVAVRYGWEDVAIAAAQESLKYPIRSLDTEAPPELNGLTASAYHELLHYHCMCGRAARMTTVDTSSARLYNPSPWFSAYLSEIGALLAERPRVNVGEGPLFQDTLRKALGQQSEAGRFEKFLKFATAELPARLEDEIAKVELKFGGQGC
ncbi:hypothetical protein DFH06DRAFT_1050365 [Mycena polygramma]|nr:hypothetical protein DFH06DRAFT_1050365 [Mycena polygramma]